MDNRKKQRTGQTPQLCSFYPNVCLAHYSRVRYRSSHTHLLLRKELEIAVVLLQEHWHEERVTKPLVIVSIIVDSICKNRAGRSFLNKVSKLLSCMCFSVAGPSLTFLGLSTGKRQV